MKVIGIIICLLFFHFSSLSQSNCLQVKGDDDKPVAYASVFIKKNKKALIADSAGTICIQGMAQIEKGDTIFISAVGYQELVSVYSGLLVIKLQKRIVLLPEVIVVNGESKTEEWGTKKNPGILGLFGCRQVFTGILSSTARIIYPEGSYKKAEIISVSFYDETGKGMNVPVRARVYLIGKDSLPIGDYLTDNIVVNTKGKGWLEVNLENKRLVFPKEGLAFAIELFATSDEYYYTEKRKTKTGKKVDDQVYGFSLAREKDINALTMTKFLAGGNKWYIERSGMGPYCGDLVCRVKVKVWR